MKVFVTSLILLAVIVCGVIINVFYINETLDSLGDLAEVARSEATDSAVSELYDYWEKHRSFIALSVSLREIDSANENLLNMMLACREGNRLILEQSYVQFCNALEDIRRYEKIKILNIL